MSPNGLDDSGAARGGVLRRVARVLHQWYVIAAAAAVCLLFFQFKSEMASAGQRVDTPGDSSCAQCHKEIAESYQRTAMAKASGPAMDGLIPGDYQHPRTGIRYRVYQEAGEAWLSFSSVHDAEVQGKRQLKYYIGSGHRGRTYLFAIDGYWFESPVNWYGQRQVWDMTPAYQDAREAPLNLPAVTSCLHCHTSGMQPPAPGTENRYPAPPFAHGGISCERCHGAGATHGRCNEGIVNPAKLDPERRDDICMQCHLEGDVAIDQPGRHLYDFRPGDRLSDFMRYFVKANARGEELRTSSQFEALASSACKRKSGNGMSCASCHDPHASPEPSQKAAYYRQKCLACHGENFVAKHHPNEDCVGCHMPRIENRVVAHAQATDHRILSRPGLTFGSVDPGDLKQLVEFPPRKDETPSLRDLALAWASLAKTGTPGADREARDFLPKALARSGDDAALLAAYGYMEQVHGATAHARELYEHSLRIDPNQSEVETNLGVIEAGAGDRGRALALWKDAFQRTPWQSAIGADLALTLCEQNRYDEAREVTMRVLQFNPDFTQGKLMLRKLNADRPAGCR